MLSPLRLPLILMLALLAFIGSTRAEIQFVGLLVTPSSTRFALTDTSTGKTDWIASNGTFAGHALGAFDSKTDTLTLTRDGTALKLRLVDDAKVQPSRLDLTGSITIGAGEKLEITRATLLYDQENVFPLKDGIVYKITPTRHDEKTVQYEVIIEKTLAPNRTERVAAPKLRALVAQPFKLQFGDYAFEFTPR